MEYIDLDDRKEYWNISYKMVKDIYFWYNELIIQNADRK